MGKYKKYKNSIEKFLASERGKRFFNFAYSWGASIVILGAMFKLLHFPFGNEMLFLGMVTECIVFFLSAFDRPIKDYNWEEVFPVLATNDPEDRPNLNVNVDVSGNFGSGNTGNSGSAANAQSTESKTSGSGKKIAVVQGDSGRTAVTPSLMPQMTQQPVSYPVGYSGGAASQQPYFDASQEGAKEQKENRASQENKPSSQPVASGDHVGQMGNVAENVDKFAQATDTLTKISEALMESYKHIIDNSQNISQNSLSYVQQMEALNKNISGLNTIYELQLRSISGQMDSIEHINNGLNRIRTMYDGSVTDSTVFKRETEKMTQQLQSLNQVYARLLEAMTVNMPATTHHPHTGFNNPASQI